MFLLFFFVFFFFNDPATTEIYTLSLHDALPIRRSIASRICSKALRSWYSGCTSSRRSSDRARSEEHTSELQSRSDLVCRLLLEKKKKKKKNNIKKQKKIKKIKKKKK